jgi:hypothetical protein
MAGNSSVILVTFGRFEIHSSRSLTLGGVDIGFVWRHDVQTSVPW